LYSSIPAVSKADVWLARTRKVSQPDGTSSRPTKDAEKSKVRLIYCYGIKIDECYSQKVTKGEKMQYPGGQNNGLQKYTRENQSGAGKRRIKNPF
jgi:hypothetical protein